MDENLLRLRDEAALLRVRQTQLAERLGSGESEAAWEKLAESWIEFESASRDGDSEAMRTALAEIGRIIRHGVGNDATWKELIRLTHDRAAIVKAEAELTHRLQHALTPEQAELIFVALAEAVRNEVKDSAVMSRISARFAVLHGRTANIIDAEPAAAATAPVAGQACEVAAG